MTEKTISDVDVKRGVKHRSRREARKKLVLKLHSDKEFSKTYFEGKAKRAADRKSVFRKKKSGKK